MAQRSAGHLRRAWKAQAAWAHSAPHFVRAPLHGELVKGMAVGKGIQVAEMFSSPFSDLLTGPGGGGKKGANRGGKGKGANKGESNNRSEVTRWHQWLKSSLSCTESTNQSILCSQPNNPESQEEEV